MKACSQIHAPVDLPHGKNALAFIVKQDFWTPAQVWMVYLFKKDQQDAHFFLNLCEKSVIIVFTLHLHADAW